MGLDVGSNGPSQITSLSPITLAKKIKFFSILSDLKCYKSAFSSSKIVFEMQSQRSSKENMFFSNYKTLFFSFFSFDPSYFINA
jgi:hypothetical protein